MALFSHASDAIELALKSEADYVDIRVENEFESSVGLRNGVICGVNSKLQDGVGIRVSLDGYWGFASTSSLDNHSIKKTVRNAIKSAKKLAKICQKPRIQLAEVAVRKTSVADSYKKHPQFLEPHERIDLISWINSIITSRAKEINVLDLKLIENHTQKIFLNSEGSEIEQILIGAGFLFGVSINGSGNFQRIRTVGYGGVGGIEQFDEPEFDRFIDGFIMTIPGIAKAKLAKSGEQRVILNEEMAWNLCHEFAHAVEADLIQEEKSPLGSRIGSKMGSEEVTIVDDASIKGFGEYYFDDEGVKASGTLIVENGILLDLIQSRETAGEMNAIPTSNGRAESCLYPPQVRQSNTFFEPGNFSFDELLEHTMNGLFICDSFGGNADLIHGNFQLDAQFGRKIEKGELGEYVLGFSLVGNLYQILGNVEGLSRNIWGFPAFCGKNGQRVRVGAISPKVCINPITIISTLAPQQFRKIELTRQRER